MFENIELGTAFGPKRKEVTEGLRKLQNEEVHHVHSSPHAYSPTTAIQLKEYETGGACSTHGGDEISTHTFSQKRLLG
jgi:hypothetical protein